MSFHAGGGEQGKDYCQKYFPQCYTPTLALSTAKYEACTRLGGTINACGCCICNQRPGEYSQDGEFGGEVECVACSVPAKFTCRGTCNVGGSNPCGKGKYCRSSAPTTNCSCKTGCKCLRGLKTLCPLKRSS